MRRPHTGHNTLWRLGGVAGHPVNDKPAKRKTGVAHTDKIVM